MYERRPGYEKGLSTLLVTASDLGNLAAKILKQNQCRGRKVLLFFRHTIGTRLSCQCFSLSLHASVEVFMMRLLD